MAGRDRLAEHGRNLAGFTVALWLTVGFHGEVLEAQQAAKEELRTTDWTTELDSGRYKIRADFELATLPELVEQLTSLEADIEALLGFQPAAESQVFLVLFETEAEYRRYMRTYFPALPQRRALFIQDRGPGMLFAFWHEEVVLDLRHEVTHALLNDGSQPLPLWLDEGLAEYFEPPRDQRLAGNPYLDQLTKRQLAPTEIQSIDQLEHINAIGDFEESHYRDSWAWVHFLIHRRPESRQLLSDFFRARSRGNNTIALGRAMQQMFPNLRQELEQHLHAVTEGIQ